MFFKLIVSGEKADMVSYIISKNPSNVFEREVAKRGKIVAKFEKYSLNVVTYKGYLENYSLPFYKICRDENMSSYVNAEQYSVCPYNLELINIVFRSVLRGKFEEISQEGFDRKYDIQFQIGPFSLYKMENIIEAFVNLGYTVIKTGGVTQATTALSIYGQKNLTTFLQQIYVISYAYTNHLRFIIPQKQDISKYVSLSKDWIEEHPARNYLINRISKVRRNIKQFETNLLENEGVENIKEKVEEKMDSMKMRASELRYRTIINYINNTNSVLDFGCGNGNLINRLLKVKKPRKLIGFDSNKKCVNTAYKRGKQQLRYYKNKETEFKAVAGSILYPDYSLFEDIDTVVLTEVIEHFDKSEVDRVLDIIFKGIKPYFVILTTPNKDYNVNFDMEEDKLRHPDHKFEFIKEEVIEFANMIQQKYGYTYTFISSQYSTSENGIEDKNTLITVETKEPKDTLSFILWFGITSDVKKDEKLIKNSEFLYTPFDLDASAYRVSSRIIREGSATFNYKVDPRWIVSLTPNMSPADSSEQEGFLEHPMEALDYYISRGVNNLIVETKYMGSNGILVAVKEKDISQKLFGSDDLIKIYSRKGYNFFDDRKIENRIYEEIRSFMKFLDCNIIALEAEILPWSYKAKTMIEKEFEKPGWCALMDKQWTGRNDTNEQAYLKSLGNYNKETDIQIYPFNILLSADFDGRKFRKVNNGNYYFHDHQLEIMGNLWYNSDIFYLVDYLLYFSETSEYKSVLEYWNRIKNAGLEGIVIKPRYPTAFLNSGRYIQSALKCRTQDYLRIIYGIDYLEPENMKFLKRRGTAQKRKLAMQQFELSQKILYSFINCNLNQRLKYIFSFFGMERVSNIDNTL